MRPQQPARGRAQHLLLVEDEPLVQHFVASTLEGAGFQVSLASGGSEALELLASDPGRYDGLISDINLGPGPNGWAVARAARENASDLPVVYTSGTRCADWESEGVPNSLMVNKPFDPEQIITAISSLLAAEAAAR